MKEKKTTASVDYVNYPIWNLFGYWGTGRGCGGWTSRPENSAVLVPAAPQTPTETAAQGGGSIPAFSGCVPMLFFAGGALFGH